METSTSGMLIPYFPLRNSRWTSWSKIKTAAY